jgi:molybdenum-dependent DNA-binding transcriptional regulator ModE
MAWASMRKIQKVLESATVQESTGKEKNGRVMTRGHRMDVTGITFGSKKSQKQWLKAKSFK